WSSLPQVVCRKLCRKPSGDEERRKGWGGPRYHPWYRSANNSWYVEVNGEQNLLGKHPECVPAPRKRKKGDPPPVPLEIEQAYHRPMPTADGKLPHLKGVISYTYRASYATAALEKGVGIAQVAELVRDRPPADRRVGPPEARDNRSESIVTHNVPAG